MCCRAFSFLGLAMVSMTVAQMKRVGFSRGAIDQYAGDHWSGRDTYEVQEAKPMPAPDGDQTGNARFRADWRGRLILEVEYEQRRDCALGGPVLAWRTATDRDLFRTRYMRKQKRLEPLI